MVGLSYTGDVRMGFAEDSRKVERIVTGSLDGLSDLYLPRLKVPDIVSSSRSGPHPSSTCAA